MRSIVSRTAAVFTVILLAILLIQIPLFGQSVDNKFCTDEKSNPFFSKSSNTPQNKNISLLGRWAEGECDAVDVKDNIICFGNGGYLMIGDITDPENPVILSKILLPGTVKDIILSGNYVYTANAGGGFNIVDIFTPDSPQLAGTYQFDGWVRDFAVQGNYAYICDLREKLIIIDFSDLSNLVTVAECDAGNPAGGIVVSGNYAYIGGEKDIHIFDISDSSNPVEIGLFDTFNPHDVFLSGNYLYVADCFDGITIIDVSDPTNPQLAGQTEMSMVSHGWDVNLTGNYSYTVDNSHIRIIDISDPENPVLIGSYEDNSILSTCVFENYLYCACGAEGLKIIDVTSKSNPIVSGVYETAGYSRDVIVNGDIAYVANRKGGLRILDISTPEDPVEIEKKDYINVEKIEVSGSSLYVHDQRTGLYILDISLPAKPEQIGFYSIEEYTRDFYISGDYAYIAQPDFCRIIDISNPAMPKEVGIIFEEDSWFSGIHVKNEFAYATYYNPFDSENVKDKGVKVFDISVPSNPVEVGNYLSIEELRSIIIKDNYAYVCGENNTFILDISDPINPVEIGSIEGRTKDVFISGDFLYLAQYGNGVKVFDISDSSAPVEFGSYNTSGSSFGIHVSDNKIYVADYEAGLYILQNDLLPQINNENRSTFDSYQLYNNYPNPFNPQTKIKFWLPEKSFVTLKVYNIAGQVVKTLVSENLPSRIYNYTWDGTNEAGQKVSSGVYIYKLQAGNITKSKKMLLVR